MGKIAQHGSTGWVGRRSLGGASSLHARVACGSRAGGGGEVVRVGGGVRGVEVVPVDSEHNAIHQCLRSGEHHEVRRLVLTASGGPFRKTPLSRLATATPEQALAHPNWRMGQRITI